MNILRVKKSQKKYLNFIFVTSITHQIIFLIIWINSSQASIFGSNDDALISSIASGQMTGKPDSHWIFVQPILSVPLTWIQRILMNYNIYMISLLLFVVIAISFALLAVYDFKSKIYTFYNLTIYAIWTFISVTILGWFSLNPTYTTASLIIAGSSSATTYALINKSKNYSKYLLLGIFILFTTAYSIRIESIYILILLVIPILLLRISQLFKILKQKEFLFFLAALIIFLGLNLIIKSITYNDSSWRDYIEINNLRHQIQLRSPEREMEKYLDEINWSQAEYGMFKRFSLVDVEKFNAENFNSIINVTKESGNTAMNDLSLSTFVETNKIGYNAYTWIVFLMFFIIVIGLFYNFNIINLISNIFIMLIILIATYYLALSLQFPERISFGLISAVLLVIFVNTFSVKPKKYRSRISNFLIVFLFIFFTQNQIDRTIRELQARAILYSEMRSVALSQSNVVSKLDKNIIVLSSINYLKNDWTNPYLAFTPIDSRKKTIYLSWANLSPVWMSNLNSLGLTVDEIYANTSRGDIYWIDKEESEPYIYKYLLNKYNSNIKYQIVQEITGTGMAIYKFQ